MPRRLIAALALLLVGVLGVGVTTALNRSGDDDSSPRAGGPTASQDPTDEPTFQPTDEATFEPTAEPTAEPSLEPVPGATASPGSGTGGSGTGGSGTGGSGTGGSGSGGSGTGGSGGSGAGQAPTTPNTGPSGLLLLPGVLAVGAAAGARRFAHRS